VGGCVQMRWHAWARKYILATKLQVDVCLHMKYKFIGVLLHMSNL
jgi:hypothetical protein